MRNTVTKIAIIVFSVLCLCGCSTEEKVVCSECDNAFPIEQLAYTSYDYVCMKCFLAEGYTLCENCHFAYVPGYDGGAAGYCDICMYDFTESCLMCEEYFKSEEMATITLASGESARACGRCVGSSLDDTIVFGPIEW